MPPEALYAYVETSHGGHVIPPLLPPMDIGTGLVAFTAGQFLVPPASEFFKRITGKLGDDVGELLAAHTTYRLRNIAEVVRLAHDKRAGRDNAQVPPRLLVPLLNAGSLEDDAYLQDRWATLLATAASDEGTKMPPYYVSALSQLAPHDARVLDGLYDATRSAQLEPPEKTAGGIPFGLTLRSLCDRYHLTRCSSPARSISSLRWGSLIENRAYGRTPATWSSPIRRSFDSLCWG